MQPDSSVKKVLIYRLGSLGDTVIALPCLHLIARVFPRAERKLLTNLPVRANAPSAAAVIGASGLVHGYIRYSLGTRSPVELLRLMREIRRFRPEVLVYLMPFRSARSVRRDRLFFRAAGVRRVVGMESEVEQQPGFDFATGLYEAEAMRLSRKIGELGDAAIDESESWNLLLSEDEREKALESLGALIRMPLIACGPGTRMQSKDWGVEKWRALLGRLNTKYPDHALVLVGSPDEAEAADLAAAEWSGAKINLCGALNPREMAAMLGRARAFLGPDSGPMHVAAAAGVPCVIPFAAVFLPGVWFPHGTQHQVIYHRTACFGCRLETCTVEGHRCQTSISVDEMEAAFDRAMSGSVGRVNMVAMA